MLIKWPQDPKYFIVSSSLKDRCQGSGIGSGNRETLHNQQCMENKFLRIDRLT